MGVFNRQCLVVLGAVLALGGAEEGWSKEKSVETAGSLLGYVILGEQGHALKGGVVPVARLVFPHAQGFTDAVCATLTMTNGEGPPIALVTRPNPSPLDLPITLCEAAIPLARKHRAKGESWTVSDRSGKSYRVQLPTVGSAPESILVLGDTGCRGTKAQTCSDQDWPLPTAMARSMAELLEKQDRPAVIVHVGDYKYRGKSDPKPHGDTNQSGLKWTNWQADFFHPLSGVQGGPNLLAMAPWVVARGNHELCRAMGDNGAGWFYLLDPTSPVAGDGAEQVKANTCQGVGDGLTAPYRLDFAHGLTLVVVDTAGLHEGREVCDGDQKVLIDQFKAVARGLEGSKRQAWLITHKPIWSGSGGCGKASFGNPTPQAALEELPQHALPEPFQVTLVGHKHLYASLDINPNDSRRRMLELGVGHGGVALNPKAYTGCLKHGGEKDAKEFYADIRGSAHFGFVAAKAEMQKDGKSVAGWKFRSMMLDKTRGPDWGGLKTAEVCELPARKGKPVCEVKEKDLFSTPCGSCDKVDAPGKKAKDCGAGEGDEES